VSGGSGFGWVPIDRFVGEPMRVRVDVVSDSTGAGGTVWTRTDDREIIVSR
jgi:hypothetical protein